MECNIKFSNFLIRSLTAVCGVVCMIGSSRKPGVKRSTCHWEKVDLSTSLQVDPGMK